MNNDEMKKIIIDQQELIVLLRNKLARSANVQWIIQ